MVLMLVMVFTLLLPSHLVSFAIEDNQDALVTINEHNHDDMMEEENPIYFRVDIGGKTACYYEENTVTGEAGYVDHWWESFNKGAACKNSGYTFFGEYWKCEMTHP